MIAAVSRPHTVLRSRAQVLVAVAALVAGAAPAAAVTGRHARDVLIAVVSNRADLVSGGDALVEVTAPPGTQVSQLRITLGGRNVTTAFVRESSNRVLGLVTGLRLGTNVVKAQFPGGHGARLTITNHAIGGPIFSGPQIQPWPCNTPGAIDRHCNHRTAYALWYRVPGVSCEGAFAVESTCFAPYDPKNPPDFVPSTTTDQGRTVPYIVRLEQGWMDRDAYNVAVLYDPSRPFTATRPQPAWNHKLLLTQGASCGAHYGEGESASSPSPGEAAIAANSPPGVLDDQALSRGFVVASAALDYSGHNCNVVLQAESIVMLKEHVIDTYGKVRYTMGQGGSGGSLSQYQVANAYPGIYQGLLPSATFPDAWSSAFSAYDCFLLQQYWDHPEHWGVGVTWTAAQMEAVQGSALSVCEAWAHVFPYSRSLFDPHKESLQQPVDVRDPRASNAGPLEAQNCGLPISETFDERSNPKGVRCDLQSYMVNVLGKRRDKLANRPVDNVGLQYGLLALKSGTISPAQFVDINAKVGSRDINWKQRSDRMAADATGVKNLYRSGAIMEATNLNQVAVIDGSSARSADIHEAWRAFAIRSRMDAAYGNHRNDVIWHTSAATPDAFLTMDRWLSNIERDTTSRSLALKIVLDKPREAVDKIDLPADLGTRAAAGAPMTRDIAKCQLRPLNRKSYSVAFTDASWGQMQKTFVSGVCDFGKPGVGQRGAIAWMQYGDAIHPVYGGKPLGPPPTSIPL